MLPYFYKLNKRIISDSLSQKLIEYFYDNENNFSSIPDGNWYLLSEEVKEFKEVSELIKSCSIRCNVVLLKHLPNTQITRHVDGGWYRRSVLATPLLPYKDYPSTYFYENEYDDAVTAIDFTDRNSVLFNTNKYHDLKVNDLVRVNFQMVFSETFENVYNLILEDKLFK